MRKTAWILTGLMAVTAAAAMAAEAPATDMSKDKGTMAAPADKGMDKMDKKAKPAKSEKTSGELTAVDDGTKKATLKEKDAKEWSFTWDDKTVVTPKGKKLEVGQNVTVWHAKDGDLATKIQIHPAKKAAKVEKTEKKPS